MPPITVRPRCGLPPSILRPRPADVDDESVVRLRLVGGQIAPASLSVLSGAAERWGDGDLHLTRRAHVQLRGLPGGALPGALVEAIASAGVPTSSTHEPVGAIMVSPQSGLSGGRADLRPVAAELDRLLRADSRLSGLPDRFLFVLDDGRGDLAARALDLGVVAVDDGHAQVRIGSDGWGPVLALEAVAARLAALARDFLTLRGGGTDVPRHIDELPPALTPGHDRDPRTWVHAAPTAYGVVPGGTHVPAPGGILSPALVGVLATQSGPFIITPWRGVLVPTIG